MFHWFLMDSGLTAPITCWQILCSMGVRYPIPTLRVYFFRSSVVDMYREVRDLGWESTVSLAQLHGGRDFLWRKQPF